jgi:hypothetical protein
MMPGWVRFGYKGLGAGPHIRVCTVGGLCVLAICESTARRHDLYTQNAVIEGALLCTVWGARVAFAHHELCLKELQEIFCEAQRSEGFDGLLGARKEHAGRALELATKVGRACSFLACLAGD